MYTPESKYPRTHISHPCTVKASEKIPRRISRHFTANGSGKNTPKYKCPLKINACTLFLFHGTIIVFFHILMIDGVCLLLESTYSQRFMACSPEDKPCKFFVSNLDFLANQCERAKTAKIRIRSLPIPSASPATLPKVWHQQVDLQNIASYQGRPGRQRLHM